MDDTNHDQSDSHFENVTAPSRPELPERESIAPLDVLVDPANESMQSSDTPQGVLWSTKLCFILSSI